MDADKTQKEKARRELQKNSTSYSGSNTSQNNNCTATYLPSQKES